MFSTNNPTFVATYFFSLTGAAGRIPIVVWAAVDYLPALPWSEVSDGQATPLPKVRRHGGGEISLYYCQLEVSAVGLLSRESPILCRGWCCTGGIDGTFNLPTYVNQKRHSGC